MKIRMCLLAFVALLLSTVSVFAEQPGTTFIQVSLDGPPHCSSLIAKVTSINNIVSGSLNTTTADVPS